MSWELKPDMVLPDVSFDMRAEALHYQSELLYARAIGGGYVPTAWWKHTIREFLGWLEPKDACGEIDALSPVTKSVMYGTILALRAAELAGGAEFLQETAQAVNIMSLDTQLLDVEDVEERKHLLLQGILDKEQAALDAGDPNVGLIQAWDEKIEPVMPTLQSFVRGGFGYGLRAAHSVIEHQGSAVLYRALNQESFDWNAAAELELFGNDSQR